MALRDAYETLSVTVRKTLDLTVPSHLVSRALEGGSRWALTAHQVGDAVVPECIEVRTCDHFWLPSRPSDAREFRALYRRLVEKAPDGVRVELDDKSVQAAYGSSSVAELRV